MFFSYNLTPSCIFIAFLCDNFKKIKTTNFFFQKIIVSKKYFLESLGVNFLSEKLKYFLTKIGKFSKIVEFKGALLPENEFQNLSLLSLLSSSNCRDNPCLHFKIVLRQLSRQPHVYPPLKKVSKNVDFSL